MSQRISNVGLTATILISDTEPASPLPNMLWLDISIGNSPILKCRNGDNTTWYVIGGRGSTANIAVAKVGGGTRTLQFGEGHYVGYTDS